MILIIFYRLHGGFSYGKAFPISVGRTELLKVPVYITKHVVLEKPVPVPEPVYIEKPYHVPVEKVIPVPVEKIIHKPVPVPIPIPEVKNILKFSLITNISIYCSNEIDKIRMNNIRLFKINNYFGRKIV